MKTLFVQLLALFWIACGSVDMAFAQLTAFTYQGRLSDAGAPATGTYDFEFTLWDSLSGGSTASAAVLGTPGGVGVTNGLFTVILDFGAGALNGAPRWIQLGVRTNGSAAAFATVTPRQAVPVVPYAVFATTASNVVAGTIGTAALAANAVTADKIAGAAVVKGINNLKDAVTIQAGSNLVVSTTGNTITLSGTTGPAWGLNGNTGIATTNFLGTTDQKALDFRVGGVRGLRLEPNSSGLPNVIGGHTNNAVAAGVLSAVIAGGGDPGAGASNSVASSYGAVGGGLRNTIRAGATGGVVAGGVGNVLEGGSYAVTSGGAYNLVQAAQSSVVGGYNNIIRSNAVNSAILSGANNLISNAATYAVIAGGDRNLIGPGSSHATVAGGLQNTNLAVRSTIGGGSLNTILSNSFDSVITGGRQNTIQGSMNYGTIGGGLRNTLQTGATYSSVVGGVDNVIQTNSTVGAILGGYQNVIQTNVSSGLIAGGSYHVISNNANYGTIVGGYQNVVGGSYGLAAGYRAKANHSGSFIWGDFTAADFATTTNNQFLIRAGGGVGIGTNKPATLLHVHGTVAATNFVGSGAGLSNLPPTSLTGILSASQVPGLDATKITSGALADARLSANVALLNSTNVFTGTNRFAGVAIVTNANSQFAGAFSGSFSGSGAGLNSVPGALPCQTVAGTAQTAAPNIAYLLTNAGLTSITLPMSPVPGDIVRVIGYGASGWRILPNAGQTIDAAGMNGGLDSNSWPARDNSRQWHAVASSTNGAVLAAVETGGQIFVSTDSGITWTARETARNWVSIALSASGVQMVAAVNGGQLFTSADSGVTWTPRDSVRDWTSVAISTNGTKMAAAVFFGQIYTSADSGASWDPRETTRQWQSIACSADGTKLVAAESFGQLHVSADSGATWTPRESSRAWTSVASSSDGSRLLACETGGRIYGSSDSGVTWIPRESDRDWRSVASSADGLKAAAVDNGGQVYLSTDAGVSWASRETDRQWIAVAMSGNGSRVLAAEQGGRLYVPLPNSITSGGFISGTQRSFLDLMAVGNGVFLPTIQQGTLAAQ